jgi:hypothetical protein
MIFLIEENLVEIWFLVNFTRLGNIAITIVDDPYQHTCQCYIHIRVCGYVLKAHQFIIAKINAKPKFKVENSSLIKGSYVLSQDKNYIGGDPDT